MRTPSLTLALKQGKGTRKFDTARCNPGSGLFQRGDQLVDTAAVFVEDGTNLGAL